MTGSIFDLVETRRPPGNHALHVVARRPFGLRQRADVEVAIPEIRDHLSRFEPKIPAALPAAVDRLEAALT